MICNDGYVTASPRFARQTANAIQPFVTQSALPIPNILLVFG